jgi:arylsulfatase A-like enzyme
MHGKSVLPVALGEAEGVREFAVAGHYKKSHSFSPGASRSIRTKEWTYIYWPDRPRELEPEDKLVRNAPELYRRDGDLNEQNNVIEEHPEIAQELELKLRRFEDELGAKGW